MPEFNQNAKKRENQKAEELAPYMKAALARKEYMQPLSPSEIPVVKASVKSAKVGALGSGAAASRCYRARPQILANCSISVKLSTYIH